ncbi:capsular exopolysaccharide synthesis family protein [Sphingomonas jinjuensis]|uniref:non-specific protein-tyrosine kinase n=1 Tax=Sphingomonas jinjuensis TaxID=535907 RepID=A0A840FKP6_9SPHN|nr:polysaccharide biosynthesis tyrosine autokinase [Sphingomonas jinjuensis]MBB4153895.1 capsular exopolysaccharide synthesis family protein [Sphingomonas jinjuensis]
MNYPDAPPISPRSFRQPYADPPAAGNDGLRIEEAPAIDFQTLWNAMIRNRWIILGIIGTCLAIGLAASMLTVPRYRASASVQIDQRVAKVLGTEDDDNVATSSADADRYLQTQVDVLKSRALAIRVADALRLTGDADFLAAAAIKREDRSPESLRLAVIDALDRGLTVTLPRNSRVVTISFASRSPTVSAKVANAYVAEFIESSLQRRFDQSAYARNFLSQQLAQAKERLEQSELSTNAYARQQRLIDASSAAGGASNPGSAPRSITAADLVQLNQVHNEAQATRLQAQERWERARATPLMSLPDVLSNQAIQELTRQRAEREAAYRQERERHKPDYPTVREAQAAIDAIDRQIRGIANGILGSIRYSYETAAAQERALGTRIDQLKGATLSEQDRSVRFNILKREADTNRELYDGLLQRFREISAASGATNNNIAVIDQAEAPARPFAPRPLVNLGIGALVGLLLAGLAATLRERLDDSIREPGDTERKLALPLLGVLPRATDDDPMRDIAKPRSPLAEASQALRTSLELTSPEGMPHVTLLTSSRQGEGKTTSAVLIALMLAQAGKRTLLIDADLRKPSLHKYLGLGNATGLSTLLAGQAEGAAVVQATAAERLSVITSGPMPPDPAQLLGSSALPDAIAAFAGSYDRIVVDAPPVLGLADAPRLASIVDGVIFVVEANRAHRGGAKAALKRLEGGRATVIGAVLTKFNRSVGYGYDYYGYGAGYGKSRLMNVFREKADA